uniref:Uncharacterized protein n=1 Tax=Opuntia streptacantha TaxID=393608 RepID=A0A7C8ZX64_OPUST
MQPYDCLHQLCIFSAKKISTNEQTLPMYYIQLKNSPRSMGKIITAIHLPINIFPMQRLRSYDFDSSLAYTRSQWIEEQSRSDGLRSYDFDSSLAYSRSQWIEEQIVGQLECEFNQLELLNSGIL